MYRFIYFVCFVSLAFAEDGVPAAMCNANACQIDKNCRCSDGPSPLVGDVTKYPQLISLTFDDAITEIVASDYIDKLLSSRINPDGEPIGATLFVPHEYTDYQKVNELYNLGYEIGVHSITNNADQEYWRSAPYKTLINEFKGQREIISKYANIPIENIRGVRTPQLQLAGNHTIKAYVQSGLTYDSSWPSLPNSRLFPYTLDYNSTEDCLLGAKCPNEAFPGFWILPINDFVGEKGKECNVIAGCNKHGSAKVISDWLTDQVNEAGSKRVPLTLMLGSGWFNATENSEDAFNQFMDNMEARKDVFFVSQKQVIDWVKSPVILSKFKTDSENKPANCAKAKCVLKKDNEDRNFNICTSCPTVYPWLENIDGNRRY